MALSIKHEEADRLAREISAQTGESLTEAVIHALRERLVRVKGRNKTKRLSEELKEISERLNNLPVLDSANADEILDYDEHGLPRTW